MPGTLLAAQRKACGLSVTAGAPDNPAVVSILTASSKPADLYRAGLAYAIGTIIPKSCAKAFQEMQRSAAIDFAPAQNALGELYEAGTVGGSVNYALGIHWYTLAARNGSARAQYNLGRLIVAGNAPVSVAVAAAPAATPTGVWGDFVTAHSSNLEKYVAAARLWTISASAGDQCLNITLECSIRRDWAFNRAPLKPGNYTS